MGAELRGALGVGGTTLLLMVAFGAIGSAVRLTLAGTLAIPRGFGITVGLGIALVAVAVALSYFLTGNALLLFVPLVLVSLVVLGVHVVRGFRRPDSGVLAALAPTRFDGIALAATLIVIGPLAAHGPVYWTAGGGDFPNYAGSTDVWLADSGAARPFLEKHPDEFGSYHVRRATREKPMATAMMVAAVAVTGTPAYSLLGATVVVSFFLLLACVLTIGDQVFRQPTVATALAVLVPTCSIVPMSRIHDAQIGHALAVALLALLLALLLTAPVRTTRSAQVVHAAAVGVVGTAALGSNPSLVTGTGPSWIALFLWLAYRSGAPLGRPVLTAVGGGIGALVLSAPLLTSYLRSLRAQSWGVGFDIPLPSPLALVGLQSTLSSVPELGQTLIAWAALLGVGAAAYAAAKRRRPGVPASAILVLTVLANGALVMARIGITNYASHKWAAVVVALVAPLGLLFLVSQVPVWAWRYSTLALGGLAAGSTALAVVAAAQVPVVVPRALLDAATDPRVGAAGTVNVALTGIYENTLAPLVVASERVVLTGFTGPYAPPSTPVGNMFFLHADRAARLGAEPNTKLGGTYVLARVDLEIAPDEPVLFGRDHPGNRRFLYGHWYPADAAGVWSYRGEAYLVFDVPDSLRSKDLVLTLHGTRDGERRTPRELVVTINGLQPVSETFAGYAPRDIVIKIPGNEVDATDGRVVVTIGEPGRFILGEFVRRERKALGFELRSLTVSAAS
jgi:hypothetical protein